MITLELGADDYSW